MNDVSCEENSENGEVFIDEKIRGFGKAFIENLQDIILVVDKVGKILFANKKAIETYGYTYNEFLNVTIFDIRNQDVRELTENQLNQALDNGIKFKTYHYKKDGTRFLVEVRSIYTNVESKDVVISIISDITDIEEIYKDATMFTTSLDIFDDPFIVFTKENNISHWSSGAEKKFGYKKKEIIGRNIYKLIPEDRLDEFHKLIASVKEGYTLRNYETIRLDRYGKEMNVLISASPIYDADRLFCGSIAIYKDITDRNIIENKLIEKCKQLEVLRQEADDANRAKSIFLANMSHEIRTPLNGILATIQLLQSTSLDANQTKYVKMMKESGNILFEIINDLLDVSKIEAGTFKLNEAYFDLKEVVNDIYNNLSIASHTKGLEIRYYFDPTIVSEVIGDKLRLQQILFNLIFNAVKFTDDGYVAFRVKRISSDEHSEKIEFKVEDSGIGIEDSFKEKIFENFHQGDLSPSKKYMGTGLGLAISKRLALLMGGDIRFESAVGQGSAFYFICEFKKHIVVNSNQNKKAPDASGTKERGPKSSKSILCVEDNIINQQVFEQVITRKGYKYIPAYSGSEALDILKNNIVDLILMDIQLPGVSGLQVTRTIRESETKEKYLPIIAMTAYATIEDKNKCLQAGMNEYFTKPFDIEELYEIIEKNIK